MVSSTGSLVFFLCLSFYSTTAAGSASPVFERDTTTTTTTFTLDEPLLAVQIGGIIAAYLFSVIFLLSLLLVVGRRLRRAVLSSNYSLQVQMMQPMKPPPSMDPSPVTPISVHLPSPGGIGHGPIPPMPGYTTNTGTRHSNNRSWSSFSKHSGSHKKSQSQLSNPSSSISLATINDGAVASDRRKAQEDLEMLYAAVMEHDEIKAANGGGGSGSPQDRNVSPTGTVNSNPFTDPPVAPVQAPTSPRTPSRLSRISSSLSLFSSSRDQSSTSLANPGAAAISSPKGPNGSGRGLGLRSPRLALPLRKMSISSPITSPRNHAARENEEEDDPYAHSPLTPRIYHPAPPPVPPLPAQMQPQVRNIGGGGGGAQRPGAQRQFTHPPPQQEQQYHQYQYQHQDPYHTDDLPQSQTGLPPLPIPRGILSSTTPESLDATNPRRPARNAPPPLTLSKPLPPTAAAAGGPDGPGRSLPLRDAYPLQSAPATKLTVLERPVKPHGAPRTGIPTPYSPYMPFTPVTPLTPSRMVTKRQRRKEGKETGLHVLREDDMVKGGGDLWGY
ncbi:uncharacterized protein BO72DRAFT_462843 [Aspergillus fijiensis CBS 313.89]|uniref:Uncharacterized protein n=1 Tax=Aspergillus fijiensis CBS 313.89 TaxID=1448319 RepID=A0A8G1RI60_9EURO|nr:uncharacterized protein BO72DRAFT_462843 [Aspergillus fijiensis CBS 313.89]RAK72563.1 hypothetical protein BO72DRAFT_462843 [Aspergillus fijiensis CBS 313.89]